MTSKTGSATGALTQFDESLWACTQEELEQAVKEYADEFGEFDADHFLDLKFHLVRGDATGRHRTYAVHLAMTLGLTGPPSVSDIIDGSAPLDTLLKQSFESSVLPTPTLGGYSFPEMDLDELAVILSRTIVHDRENKLLVCLAFLLNYTACDQQNVGLNSVSSSGKSYICLEIAKYFPEEDVMDLGYASAQAFFHEFGVLSLPDGTPIVSRELFVLNGLKKWEEENPEPSLGGGVGKWRDQRTEASKALKARWDEVEKVHTINLKQKIMLFLDQPDDVLLQRIRPFLSHDKEVIQAKITDKTTSGQNKTKTVNIVGFPTIAFLSTRFSLDEQERSRMWWLSADVGIDKIESSIMMLSERLKDRARFERGLEEDENRGRLRDRISAIKHMAIEDVVLSDEDMQYMTKTFLDRQNGNLIPRHQRDFPRLVAIAKAHALLNLWTRQRNNGNLHAERKDVEVALDLYAKVARSNELGIPPVVYDFWMEKVSPALEDAIDVEVVDGVERAVQRGLSRRELGTLYREHFRERIGGKKLKQWIDILCEVGLVSEETDPNDGRSKRLYPLGVGVGKTQDSNKHLKKATPPSDGQLTLDIHESSELSEHAVRAGHSGHGKRAFSARANNIMQLHDQMTDEDLEHLWPPSREQGSMDFSDEDRFVESMECDEDE